MNFKNKKEKKKNIMTNNKKIKLEDFKNDWFEGAAELQYIKAQVREELTKKGFLIDSSFEYGDNNEWVGVYARPQDKPTALDPYDEEEEKEQEKYAINGMKQDFSEWFEWDIKNNNLVL